ncbi:aromatic-ring-hydroxylating dioxygenase subunit beta [Marinomonas algicola]|uniref:aromatic-ring-hydroxylating dioxygenase subunit beta n=1 Tax=Marinomonas algicola TaxID=2773454 RepID=UPI0017486C31|nr:aromatic-ring-hydroxylating dioxygenase subunit beta [Marinomonas algicola]
MSELQHQIEQFLYYQAALCDNKEWDAYLDTYTEDSTFWIPQWESEYTYVADPKKGMSLIYYASRSGLEDRVYRLRTGKSSASSPLPRTQHQLSNVKLSDIRDNSLEVTAGWQTNYTRMGRTEMLYGEVKLSLVKVDLDWKIKRKHCVVNNDIINSVMDFYHV